jgi:phage-related protein (TIGR01555 family)
MPDMNKPQEPKASETPKRTVDAMKVFAAEAKAGKTADGFDNFASRLGLNNDNALSSGTYEFNLVTRNRTKLEAAYRGSWVVGAVVDSVAEDMTRAGISVTTNEDKESDLKDLMSAISRLQVSQSLCANIKWGRLYGGSIAVIQIKGQDLQSELDINTVGKDQFAGLTVFDRWQLNPDLTSVIQSGPEMGLPEYYNIVTTSTSVDPQAQQNAEQMKNMPRATGQIKVHHSRVIRSIGIELPFFQAITESMWGESILERMWDRLISFDNATMSSASLIDRANLRTIGIQGLREIIAAGGAAQQGLLAMFEMMRLMQVNEGLTLLDKEDEFSSTAYSFAGLADMMLQFAQQLSGASGIPLVRLYGQPPAGLSASSDGEIRMYYDNINAQQNAKLHNGWDKILKVMWRSVFGKDAPKDLNFHFVPLWQMSAVDKAAVSKSNTETIVGAYEAGLVSRSAAMKDLRNTSAETGMFGNITDEEIKEAEEEDPPEPDMAPEDPTLDPEKAESPEEAVKNFDGKTTDQKVSWFKRWLAK